MVLFVPSPFQFHRQAPPHNTNNLDDNIYHGALFDHMARSDVVLLRRVVFVLSSDVVP